MSFRRGGGLYLSVMSFVICPGLVSLYKVVFVILGRWQTARVPEATGRVPEEGPEGNTYN